MERSIVTDGPFAGMPRAHQPIIHDPIFHSRDPNDKMASCGGHGTLEALAMTKTLEEAGIPCCVVGISALIYFGAGRVRNDWEICVPTDMLEKAHALLLAKDIYETYPPNPVWERSLLHTFPRIKVKDIALCLVLVPSEDAHLDCSASNIERDHNGLPYPTLEVFAQSLLDTNSMVDLADLVDGMNLTEEWGLQHLRLEGENDIPWTQQKNERIRASVPKEPLSGLLELVSKPINLKDTWHSIVAGKECRIGIECPKEIFVTRFRCRGDVDPRLMGRDETLT